MRAPQNEYDKRRKKRRSRIVMTILVMLIPIFFAGFIVGKSYAINEKSSKQDMTEKVEPSINQGKEQTNLKEESLEHSNSEVNNNTQQDSTEEVEAPISQDKEQASTEEISLDKVVYLTFDDGPSILTGQFLDVLYEQNVKVTFFMQGSNLKKKHLQESVKRATTEGHYIGAHSMTHESKTLYKDNQFVPEMNEALALIHEITGTNPRLVRPPYGSAPGLKSEQIRNQIVDANIKVWDWTIDSNDWSLKDNPSQIIENIKSGTKADREVVLMHEKPQTLAALPEIIAFYREQGYKFAVYEEANHFALNFQKDARL